MSKKNQVTYESEESLADSSQDKKLKQIKQKLKDCQKDKENYLAGWQRAQADMVNFRRRQETSLKALPLMSRAEVIAAILPVLDSLRVAGQQEGIAQINQQLITALSSFGLKEISTDGEMFNPQIHEAIAQVKSEQPSQTIVEEVQKGYLLNNHLLRPSKVKVAK